MKVIRDPVHNIIYFDKDEEAVLLELIDTQEFQRLRHIKQLGLSPFTYPGAEHTRFAHSIGVTHLMKRFVNKICSLKEERFRQYINELNDYRKQLLAAALLHDVGHGPFSHALEKTTEINHERWTIEIIRGDTEVNSVLHKHGINPHEVAEIVQRTHTSKAVVKLLSSQLDTDRVDYLLRDSKLTGAGYGSFDLEWLINVLRIGEHNGEVEVGLDRNKGLSIAEDFVMARYYMYINVYFHKTTRSAELIVDKIFKRAMELFHDKQIDLPDDLIAVLECNGQTDKALVHYINLTDHTVWHYFYQWSKHSDPILSDLSSRLLKRDFFKEVPMSEMYDMEMWTRITNYFSNQDLLKNYYLAIDDAKSSSYKDSYILQKPKTDEKEEEREASEYILLFDHKGNGTELSKVSDIINSIRNKPISIRRLFMPKQYIEEIFGG
ncbi:HD superfamily phosphohydrolase [Thermobacillus composti KWC4]|uniref:HD superfamily phosphohydrolase n=1 Tax=Thermobacillus composti (strain DSM 18247 / JCM 13945 / KWC4) TaxID=717605 RepID=L0EIC9_THECK|nr:HD domain-containing protein [Thermobacillus composti]AGA59446.1 HD superfamily phosphohydrolase [Thermobacillus composti KWC4]